MLCCVTAVCLCKTIEKSVLGESLFSVLRDSILNPILDSLFSIFYFVIHVVKDCVVPENIQTPTTEGIGNSRGVGGSEAQEIPEGRGVGP